MLSAHRCVCAQVVDETFELSKSGERSPIGMVVVRGNSIVLMEARERI
jgi:hypothetical protein